VRVSGSVRGGDQRDAVCVSGSRERVRPAARDPSSAYRPPNSLTPSPTRAATREPRPGLPSGWESPDQP
jgi:hypothetical protein